MSKALVCQAGFGKLPCPRCGQDDSVWLHLERVDEFECGQCDERFNETELRDIIERWTPVLAWLETAPANRPVPTESPV